MKEIDAFQLKNWLDNDQVTLIDVREVEENSRVRIKSSILLPMSSFDLDQVKPQKGRKIVFYCKMGIRSQDVALFYESAVGPSAEVFNLSGGIEAWVNAGNEVESGVKSGEE